MLRFQQRPLLGCLDEKYALNDVDLTSVTHFPAPGDEQTQCFSNQCRRRSNNSSSSSSIASYTMLLQLQLQQHQQRWRRQAMQADEGHMHGHLQGTTTAAAGRNTNSSNITLLGPPPQAADGPEDASISIGIGIGVGLGLPLDPCTCAGPVALAPQFRLLSQRLGAPAPPASASSRYFALLPETAQGTGLQATSRYRYRSLYHDQHYSRLDLTISSVPIHLRPLIFAVLPIVWDEDLRRIQLVHPAAKLVMNGQLGQDPSPKSQPSTTNSDPPVVVLPPSVCDVPNTQNQPPPTLPFPALRSVMNDLTDTPQSARSRSSTAPSSPRIPPLRQNSGSQTPRVRPHATTLNIPGMTRSKVSPDGRIPERDVAAKLVIIMVGLPARGKSYITKKLQRYLSWQQHESRIFNVGNRRRNAAGKRASIHPRLAPEPARLDPPVEAAAILLNGHPHPTYTMHHHRYLELPTTFDLNADKGEEEPQDDKDAENADDVDQSAKFFDPKNEKASALREEVAMQTLDELIDYLVDGGGAVGILDATNSTITRRQHLVDHIKQREPKLGILFIESICHDPTLLEANMRLKLSGPDYRNKDPLQSLQDFKKRVEAYASAYQPLGDYEEKNDFQYIQMIDVGRKLVQHRLKGFLSGGISTYLASFNLSPRQIWITRHGQSIDNELGKLGGDSPLTERGHCYAQALYKFMTHKRQEWLIEQKSKMAQATFPPLPGEHTPPYPEMNRELDEKNFCVWTSMLQRSAETAEYFDVDDDYDVKNWEMLNELNAGQFEGMTYAEIAKNHPNEFKKRSQDKLNYIYPGVGGEGYLQVISRLRDMVREIERITDHLLIIGHRSVCRVLMAYFMDLTHEDITDMDVPLGMLYAIEPKPYGIEFHAYRYNEDQAWFDELPNYKPQKAARGSV